LLNEKGSWVVMGGVYPIGVVVNSGLVVVVWNCYCSLGSGMRNVE